MGWVDCREVTEDTTRRKVSLTTSPSLGLPSIQGFKAGTVEAHIHETWLVTIPTRSQRLNSQHSTFIPVYLSFLKEQRPKEGLWHCPSCVFVFIFSSNVSMKQELSPQQGLCPQNVLKTWKNKSDKYGQRVGGDGEWGKKKKEPNNKTNKQTKTYRHTETEGLIQVPARQLLTDKRRAPSAPNPGGAAFCWGLKWIMKGGQRGEGGNTASGREPLISLETQTDRHCRSIFTQREAEVRTEPG